MDKFKLQPSVMVVETKEGESVVSAFRSRFPSLYSLGRSSNNEEDEAAPPSTSKAALGNEVATSVLKAQTPDNTNPLSEQITGLAQMLFSMFNPALVVAAKVVGSNSEIMKQFKEQVYPDAVKSIAQGVKDKVNSLGVLDATIINSALSMMTLKFVPGAAAVINKNLGTKEAYIKSISSAVIPADKRALFARVARANDGTKTGADYPFSTKQAMTDDGLAAWFRSYDTELQRWGSLIRGALDRVPNPHPLLATAPVHWTAFLLAFANNESNFDPKAKNLLQGHDKLVEGKLSRHGAFGAFQQRWSYATNHFKANPSLFKGKSLDNFDNDPGMQAMLIALHLNENIKFAARNWFSKSPDGSIVWVNDKAAGLAASIINTSGGFGPSPVGVLTSLVNVGLAVGFINPITTAANATSVPNKLKELEKFDANLKGKVKNTALFELSLSIGMPLAAFARILQSE